MNTEIDVKKTGNLKLGLTPGILKMELAFADDSSYKIANGGGSFAEISLDDRASTNYALLTIKTEVKGSDDSAAFAFKNMSCSRPALANTTENWPELLNVAYKVNFKITVETKDGEDPQTFEWRSTVFGFDTSGKDKWWISSCDARKREEIEIAGFVLDADLYILQEVEGFHKYAHIALKAISDDEFELFVKLDHTKLF